MRISTADSATAKRVWFARAGKRSWLMVELADGRAIGMPLSKFPTLQRATPAQRQRVRAIGKGEGLHWPALDFDLSVRGFLEGRGEVRPRGVRKSA